MERGGGTARGSRRVLPLAARSSGLSAKRRPSCSTFGAGQEVIHLRRFHRSTLSYLEAPRKIALAQRRSGLAGGRTTGCGAATGSRSRRQVDQIEAGAKAPMLASLRTPT